MPVLTGEQVLSKEGTNVGGWGETWTFKVNVTDEDLDPLTLKLWIKKADEGTWILANSTSYIDNPDLNGTINKTIVLTYKNPSLFQTRQGEWYYYFEAEDIRNYIGNTTINSFFIEKDDINISLVAGDGASVWRNGTDIAYLVVYVYDLDREEGANDANVTFFVTLNGTAFDSGTIVYSNGTGYAAFEFNPECDPIYKTGIQYWKAVVVSDDYYKSASSSNFTVTIKSKINLRVDYPDGQAFLRGTLVPFYASVYDECEYVNGADILLYGVWGANQFSCTPVYNMNNGTYNCTFDTSGKPFGWYSIKMMARKNYYSEYPSYTTITKPNAFFVASNPVINSFTIDHYFGGWGELYNFDIRITDTDASPNNVTLWKSYDNVTWIYVDSKVVTPTYSNYPVSFSRRFDCEDYLTNSTVFFKVTTVDVNGFNDTSQILNITFERDDVTVSLASDSSSSVRRIGENNAYLRAIVYDSDRGIYPSGSNLTIWVTRDGMTYDYFLNCTSSNGNCTVYYNPDCSSKEGIQYWFAQSGDYCYKQVNSTNKTLTIIGQLNVSIISPENNAILQRGIINLLNASVYDECLNVRHNATTRWYNSSWNLLASGQNATWLIPPSYKLGSDIIYVNVSESNFDPNFNSTQVFIYGWSRVNFVSPENGTIAESGTLVNLVCRVLDFNTSQPISNYSVKFFKNDLMIGSSLSDSEGYAQLNWNTFGEPAGNYNVSCRIETNSTLFYIPAVPQASIIITLKRPLIIDEIIAPPFVYRNDTFTPNKANITVHVKDAQIGDAVGANVSFYMLDNYIGSCLTNSSGYCSLINLDFPDDFTPSLVTIYINATRDINEPSETVNTSIQVKGILFTTIISPENNSYFSKAQSIPVQADVVSENGETLEYLNETGLAVEWWNETTKLVEGISTIIPQSIVAQQSTGEHSLMAVAKKSYYDDGKANVTIYINSLADVLWISPLNDTILPYPEPFNITCMVKDTYAGGIADYNVSVYYKIEPSTEFIFLASLKTNSSGYATYEFEPYEKGNHTFMCNITDDNDKYYSAYGKVSGATFWVKDVYLPTIFNINVTPVYGLEANLNSTQVFATISDNYDINSVWLNVSLPNGSYEIVPMYNVSPKVKIGDYVFANYSTTYLPRLDGNHSLYIYAMDMPPESNVNFTLASEIVVYGKVYGDAKTDISEIIATGITQNRGFNFTVIANFTNLGPATAYNVNLTHSESPIGSLRYNESFKQCGALSNAVL